ncbi:unnamed protein product [Paramecium primaurelia]|uniref:Homeodomain protein n=1 Tax=Paramecium primaurelia TaxID=5886 RepID=A0A8S1MQP2_PARPR|nr:unnamed protein product [Paramecium primaurelia]
MISLVNNQAAEQPANHKQNNKKYWNNEEDIKLKSAVNLHGSNWKVIAEYLPGRNASQCAQRWKRIKPKEDERNQKWSKEEDEAVLRLTQSFQYNWRLIAHHIPNRTSRQIRERFVNHLDPNIIKSPWTEEEDKWIWNMYQNIGTKWSDMSKQLLGRPENMIKNRFYSYIRKQYGKIQNPYYVVPNNVRILEKEQQRKNNIIKKRRKFRRFHQIKTIQQIKQGKQQLQQENEQQIQQEQFLQNQYPYLQQQYQSYYHFIQTEYQQLLYPKLIYPYQFINSSNLNPEFNGQLNPQDLLNCKIEQMNQQTTFDLTKLQNNEIQMTTLSLSKIGVNQIQLQQIDIKEEEDNDNPKNQNKNIENSTYPLQIRADILKEIQKKNFENEFKQ